MVGTNTWQWWNKERGEWSVYAITIAVQEPGEEGFQPLAPSPVPTAPPAAAPEEKPAATEKAPEPAAAGGDEAAAATAAAAAAVAMAATTPDEAAKEASADAEVQAVVEGEAKQAPGQPEAATEPAAESGGAD